MIDRVNALVLVVRDVESCALFYRDKLGFHLDQLERDEAYLTSGRAMASSLPSNHWTWPHSKSPLNA